jgi:poly(hydroxyalkanoate) depolymerase family esterase
LNHFLQKIFAATGLTRRGRLAEATHSIQQALGVHGAPRASGATQAEPVKARTQAPGDILDGLVREVAPSGLTGEARLAGSATETAETTLPDAGAAAEPAVGRFAASTFTGASGTRRFKLFEPAGFEGRTLPLVVMLHGCTQDADDFAAGTRMNELAQERGLFILYPEQAPRSNTHKCWNWFMPGDQRRGQGEPALLAGMTRHVMATHPVDVDRVYVAGLSAGGAMAAILAREYPDLFAAAGVHSGLPPGAAHDVASAFAAMKSGPSTGTSGSAGLASIAMPAPLVAWPSIAPPETEAGADAAHGAPLIVFHGDADVTVHASNGAHVVDAALGTAAWQATRHSEAAADGPSFTQVVYRAADASPAAPSRAEHWVVHGARHAWSGGDATGTFTESSGPDASREMLRFFAEHPRRHDPAKRPAGY